MRIASFGPDIKVWVVGDGMRQGGVVSVVFDGYGWWS